MFRSHLRVNPLESRKRLLVAESELNRAQLGQEWEAIADGVRLLCDRAKSYGAIASAAALLLTGLAAFRRGKTVNAPAKLSWLQTILKGANAVSTLWLAFRSRGCGQKDK